MDLNSNLNKSVNNSGNFNILPPQQNMANPTFTPEQLMAVQQMQLNTRMGNLTMTNGLQSNVYPNQNVTSPYIFPTVPNLIQSSTGYMTGVLPLSPSSQMPMMQFPQSFEHSTGQSLQQPTADTTQQLTLLLKLQNNIPSAVDLRKTVKQDLARYQQDEESQYTPQDEYQHSPDSTHVSTPLNGSSPSTPIISTRRQLILSETSSTTSSGPASPSSGIGLPLSSPSDYSPGPNSPKSPVSSRHLSEPQTQTTNVPKQQTRASSLKYEPKYPQDQCYRCMKKVYPVEKIGPIKDVVYHKGCFSCKTCGTKLNLKNFCHNKNEDWDIHVYCKSHCDQGSPQAVHIDANSVLIKGAMAAPKLGRINEQIRGNNETHKGGKMDANAVNIRSALSVPKKDDQNVKQHNNRYHLDLQSMEIAHARNVPATDLQTGNKIKPQSWTREQRKSESVPPPDVVKYSDLVPEYDMDSYQKLQVESNPDYDR